MGREFEKLYHEEAYLFGVVGPAFRRTGRLRAYDFFFIVRWKANRAIRKVAHRVLKVGGSDLQSAVARLGRDVTAAKDSAQRLSVLTEKWGLRLPMASAILTVFYPEDFTVYDVRVAKQVGSFQHLAARRGPGLWSGYVQFMRAVERAVPGPLPLRDKDRFLWARSRHNDLVEGLKRSFERRPGLSNNRMKLTRGEGGARVSRRSARAAS